MAANSLFRRSLFGYRRQAVDEALVVLDAELGRREQRLKEQEAQLEERDAELEERDRRIAIVDAVADELAALVVERDRALRELREELAALRAREQDQRRTRERVEREVAEIGAQARGQATRIRMQALRHAAQLAGRSERGANGGVEAAAEKLADPGGEPRVAHVAPVAEQPPGTNGHVPGAGIDRFEGLIHLEIGPLSDFSQLVGFEDAANQIGATSEISVKRFSRGRATLAVRLDQPVELLRELEERAPFEFRVRSLRDDRLILDVGD